MNRTCRHCQSDFEVTDDDLGFYERMDVPAPTWCPPCREMRRMAWYTERYLYPGQCNRCRKSMVTQFAPGNPRPQYCFQCWWGDGWDALAYGRNYDPTRSFFDQFHELELTVPHACTSNDSMNVNSEYTHQAGHNKNCYLIFHASYNEDCYYGYGVKAVKNCMDVHYCHKGSELCYECVDVEGCYGLSWCQDCQNCSESAFIQDCIGCSDCFLCVGLRNKRHCILNEQLSPEEYTKRRAEMPVSSWSVVQTLRQRFRELQMKHHWKCLRTEMTENSSGNYLYRARNAKQCFDCSDIEECAYCSQLQMNSRSCYDIFEFGIGIERCYETTGVGYSSYDIAFCVSCMESSARLQYCIDCFTSSDCFGCTQLKRGKFCILNRQYTEPEYHALRKTIIENMKRDGEYGEFFPLQYSFTGYNESTAQWWYPKTKEETLQSGWPWEDDLPRTEGKETLNVIPDDIKDVDDSVLQKILRCEACAKNYKIIPQELAFYRKRGLPLPHRCFDCRRMDRMVQRNPRTLWTRPCMKCAQDMQTTYAPDRPEIVYCETCYLQSTY